ncbi:MAG TPA: iron-sulfur cluster-binding domain-containing protein [Candidatus Acidoferrales bacterium]|nr:iron-sulfur cluster-binding domain-containing protein [Candidatus Acidoferrales bacterium]
MRFLLPEGQQLHFRPGQFLTIEFAIDGKSVKRSYSICSSPTQTGYVEITPKRMEKGRVSCFLNDLTQVGLVVKARGPYGQFYFDENKHKRIVLIAAGSGITPMMAMLRYIDDLCLPVNGDLIYCVRKEEDIFFLKDLQAFQSRFGRLHVVFVVSQPSPYWKGWSGRLRREILDLEVENPLESTFFMCGPPAFMSLGRSLLKDMSVNPDRILQESFGGAVSAERQLSPDTGPLTVKFARSAVAYNVSSDETLLESSERRGLLIPSGCRQGSCGTCMTKLLGGDVRMEPQEALSDQQRSQGYILPCVSRPLTDVTLDA